MLAHRLRRWPNIAPTLAERLVLAGLPLGELPTERTNHNLVMSISRAVGDVQEQRDVYPMFGKFWATICNGGPAFSQQYLMCTSRIMRYIAPCLEWSPDRWRHSHVSGGKST